MTVPTDPADDPRINWANFIPSEVDALIESLRARLQAAEELRDRYKLAGDAIQRGREYWRQQAEAADLEWRTAKAALQHARGLCDEAAQRGFIGKPARDWLLARIPDTEQ